MKTAISLPDNLFARAEKFAQDHDMSRSALIAEALRDYLNKHHSDDLTAKINAAVATAGQPSDEAVMSQSNAVLKRLPW
jgi:metal-responsive CopG/Arc/MetJ family transcriptional regulator